MSRKERLEILGDKAKKFTNIYIKNLGEDMTDEKLKDMFEPYGAIVSAKVGVQAVAINYWQQNPSAHYVSIGCHIFCNIWLWVYDKFLDFDFTVDSQQTKWY